VLLSVIEPKDRQRRAAFAALEAVKATPLPPFYLCMGPAVVDLLEALLGVPAGAR